MENYVGIMGIGNLNEAIVATNGFWRHFKKFPSTHKPLIGLSIDSVTEDNNGLSRIDKLSMMLSATADIADIAIGYENHIANNQNFVEDLKDVANTSEFRKKIKAFYFKNLPDIYIVEELKIAFPRVATILSINGKNLGIPEKTVANIKLYGKNLNEVLVGTTCKKRETPESLYRAYETYSILRRTNPQMTVGFSGNFRYVNDGLAEVLEFARRENCPICFEKPSMDDKKYSFENHTRELVREVASAFSTPRTI